LGVRIDDHFFMASYLPPQIVFAEKSE